MLLMGSHLMRWTPQNVDPSGLVLPKSWKVNEGCLVVLMQEFEDHL